MPLKTLRACALAEVFPGPGMRRAQWLLSERGGGGPEEMLRPPLPLRNLERNGNGNLDLGANGSECTSLFHGLVIIISWLW